MSLKRISFPERLITHGVLIAGSIIFAFPFLWMLGTSAKIRREMAAENLRLLPHRPRPQMVSPYIDTEEYGDPRRPEGIPEAVWEEVLPRLNDQLNHTVDAWTPQTIGPDDNPPPAEVELKTYRTEMIQGLIKVLGSRISDEAREKAINVEKQLRSSRVHQEEQPSYAELARDLSDKAIQAGVEVILMDTERLVDEKMLRTIFDSCYRRLCLGALRVRTQDYKVHSPYTGHEWKVASGPAQLAKRTEVAVRAQEVRLRFTPEQESATFRFEKNLPFGAEIDRVYVGYRGDATWASVSFEVNRAGELWRTTDKIHLYDRDWVEQELRWPSREHDPMARRLYAVLQRVGDAPPGSPDFEVRMAVTKASHWGALYAKVTRNYRQAFKEVPYARYIMTSFALTILNIILAVFSCTLVAFAFARLEWPGRDLCFGILLATMMVPPQVLMIPQFLVNKYLGWYNTLIPLWIYSGFGLPFFVFLLRQFLKNIPKDLEDAARIDGCGFLRIYWHVMMPLVKPTIAVIAIYTFMGVWNNFMGPLIYVNDERLFPLALGMFKFQLRSGADVGLMMAGSFIMTLPIIVLFFFAQRYFIQGISLTGMKG